MANSTFTEGKSMKESDMRLLLVSIVDSQFHEYVERGSSCITFTSISTPHVCIRMQTQSDNCRESAAIDTFFFSRHHASIVTVSSITDRAFFPLPFYPNTIHSHLKLTSSRSTTYDIPASGPIQAFCAKVSAGI